MRRLEITFAAGVLVHRRINLANLVYGTVTKGNRFCEVVKFHIKHGKTFRSKHAYNFSGREKGDEGGDLFGIF